MSLGHLFAWSLDIHRGFLDVGGVNAHGDVCNHAVLGVDAIRGDDVENGVPAVLQAVREELVDVVGHARGLSVARVRLQGHHLRRKGLVEIKLTRADEITRADGTIREEGVVRVHLAVDVEAAAGVEAWEDRLHLHYTLGVGRVHSSQECRVVRVQVSHSVLHLVSGHVERGEEVSKDQTGVQGGKGRVGARRIGVPKAHHHVCEWLTCGHVENTNIHGQRNAWLVLTHLYIFEPLAMAIIMCESGHDGERDE